MRTLVAAIAALMFIAPSGAHAQGRSGGARRMPPPQTPAPPPRPAVAPPPIVYPFPPLMPPPAGGLTQPAGGLPPPVHDSFRPQRRNPLFLPFGSGYAPFGYGYADPTTSIDRTPMARTLPQTGLLRLAVTPASAQVFVDSYYVGTIADIDAQRVLQLEAGPHRIEFRAPQYRTLTVDIRVQPLETVTYRGALEPERPQAAVTPAPAGPPTVMYVIPNCYLGNLPPRQNRLPSGCDVKQVQVLKPTADAAR
jgi:hypothetical protein